MLNLYWSYFARNEIIHGTRVITDNCALRQARDFAGLKNCIAF